jgi:hypothetical protein
MRAQKVATLLRLLSARTRGAIWIVGQGGEEQARTISRLRLPAAAVIARQGPSFAGGGGERETREEIREKKVGEDGGKRKGVWIRGDRGGALMRGVGKVVIERSVTESEREIVITIPPFLVGKKVMPVPSMLPRTMPTTALKKTV